MLKMKKLVVLLAAGTVALAGCGPKESATPAKSAGGAPADATKAASTAAAPAAPKSPCTTDLKLVNAEAAKVAGLTDRPLAIQTAWAEGAPHPKNTVDKDKYVELMLTEYPVEKDKQFGYSIPVGVPKVPEGKIFLKFRLTNAANKLAARQAYSGATGATDSASEFLYYGDARLLPGDATVTITEINDDVFCGKITSVAKTAMQSFVGIEGTFKADRIPALEARDEKK